MKRSENAKERPGEPELPKFGHLPPVVTIVLQDCENIARRPTFRVPWIDASNVAGGVQPANQAPILFRDVLR
jgi:hypothetical protein